jgi:AcrR family transcriptional regulator
MNGEKRDRILKAAEKEFSENGYKKASVARIAAEAGVAVGTVYSCFSGKERLFEAVRRPGLKDYNPAYEGKRAQILKAALKVFGKNGYAAATMDAVAAACGCNKAVLYQYFQNKEALFTALFYEPKFAGSLEDFRFSNTEAEPSGILRELGMAFLALFDDPDRVSLLKMVVAESGRFPELGPLLYENTVRKVGERAAEILERLAGRGALAKTDFRLAARAYFGLLYSFVLTDKILNPNGKQYGNEQIAGFASAVFSRGLKP